MAATNSFCERLCVDLFLSASGAGGWRVTSHYVRYYEVFVLLYDVPGT
jgi:hypothetical protein